MQFFFEDIKVYYKVFGRGEPLIFLHGWGATSDIFCNLSKYFSSHFKIVLVDFPPFGKSEMPKKVWGVEDYAKMLHGLTVKLNLKKINIIAHSFGGRVAINFACCYNNLVNKLVLTGAAGLKSKKGFLLPSKIFLYKIKKKFGLNTKKFGSNDYKILDEQMKKSFVKIVNYFQEDECKKIRVPTIIIQGKKDRDVSLFQAKKMNKLIENSKLIVLKRSGHFCFLDDEEEFFDLTFYFLKAKKEG